METLVATDEGLIELSDGAGPRPVRAGKVSHLAAGDGVDTWALVDDAPERLRGGEWTRFDWPAEHAPRSLLAVAEELFVGTAGAHLYVARGGAVESAELVEGFESADGRETWHTPWGGPPDVRSLARGVDSTLYANVHVGGVLRSSDARRWQPTMDIGADVHQVVAHPEVAGCVVVASAWGLGTTFDGGDTWEFTDDALHSAYCRAVAVAGDHVLISASNGPRGGRGAIYRRKLRDGGPLAKCAEGLPDWFDDNIDSGCLAASGSEAAFGTADGRVFASSDEGVTWRLAAHGLPPIRSLVF